VKRLRTIFSTAELPPAEAFDYWRDVVCANLPGRWVEVSDRTKFYAEMQTGALGDLGLVSWRASPSISHIESSDDLVILLPCSRGQVEFVSHSFEIDRQNLYLFDVRQPHIARSFEPVERTLLRIPREVLERRINLAASVNRPLPLRGDLALLSAFVRELIRIGPTGLSGPAAAIISQQLLDLTAVAIGSLSGVTPRLGAASQYGTLKLRLAIDRQLSNPAADRQSISAAAGISERHANRLLALEGTSIRRLLMERRLAKARAAFEDPLQRHRSIGEVAFACGFSNLSHFTHAFKNRYGLTPSDYRNTR